MNFKYSFCEEAALAGDLEEIKRMHLAGYPWDWRTIAHAAGNGHLECLKYAYENKCSYINWALVYASENGHLECLKYLYEKENDWNNWTPVYAAKNGHLDCFKYCFERWNDPQTFWNNTYELDKIIEQIDLDEKIWRTLFTLDLSKCSLLKDKVESKKREIEEKKKICKEVLEDILPLDIIKYCIYPFF